MISEKRDFFISFNSADKAWADWIAFQLKRKGHTMYYQYDDFPPGSDFMQQMNLAMSNTRLTIAVWTKNYFSSGFASLEARAALKQGISGGNIKLVPIKVEDCSIDPLYSTLVYINLVGYKDFEAQKLLISGIEATLSIGKSSDIKKAPKFPPYVKNEEIKSSEYKRTGLCIPAPLKVLYSGSKKSSDLDLEASYQSLSKGLNKHIKNGTLKFIKHLSINTSNIFDVLLKYQPSVFHFTGKQDGGDIRITDEDNHITTVSDLELAGYLTSFGDNIKLAVIDTCYSFNCAKSISDVVDFAIGVEDSIYDCDADKFYKVFYNALCSGHSIKDAVGQATASLKFLKVPLKGIPVLFSKKSADPTKSYFATKNQFIEN